MIILLTGPSGSGKTDTSWALLQVFERIVFLDCDWFASYTPFSWKKESDVESVYQSIALMIDFHRKRHKKNFVITLTYEMAELFEKFKFYIFDQGYQVKTFRLRCENHELERRIRGRDRIEWQKQQELNNMSAEQAAFDNSFPNDQMFKLIDVTERTEESIANMIASLCG